MLSAFAVMHARRFARGNAQSGSERELASTQPLTTQARRNWSRRVPFGRKVRFAGVCLARISTGGNVFVREPAVFRTDHGANRK